MKKNMHLFITRSILLRTRKVSEKSCGESQNTNFIFNNYFENRAFYLMWKTFVQAGRSQMTIRSTCHSCGISKATNTLPDYGMFIACPLPQWLH